MYDCSKGEMNMSNRYLITETMLIDLTRVCGIWLNHDKTKINVDFADTDTSYYFERGTLEYDHIVSWLKNCANNKTNVNPESGIFVCSSCGAPNTD